jgi:hypothetical protein
MRQDLPGTGRIQDDGPLLRLLRGIRRRLLLALWAHVTTTMLVAALLGSAFWLVLTRLFPILGNPSPVTLALIGTATALALLLTTLRRPSLLAAALEADRRAQLSERLTSSYELADRQEPMYEALHMDARNHLKIINLRSHFPFKPPRLTKHFAVLSVAYIVGLTFFPELDLLGYREKQAQQQKREQAVRVKAQRLKNAARPLREKLDEEELADLSGLADDVERIAEGLVAAELTDKQALARLTNLTDELAEQRQKLGADIPAPKIAGDPNKLGMTKDVASDIEKGEYGEAAAKLGEMGDKLAKGEMSPEDIKNLAKDLANLAEMAGGEESLLGEALAEAAEGLNSDDLGAAGAKLQAAMLSLEQAAQMMEQLESLEGVMGELVAMEGELAGDGNYMGKRMAMIKGMGQGRMSGMGRYGSMFTEGGLGMGGPGRGRGNQIGELPDVEGTMNPTMLPGEMTRGKVLASIMGRAAPEEGAESTIEMVSQAVIQVQQEAEQALTKEEIPPGAREFVREYFGSLEPEKRGGPRVAPQ